jgi:O-antigen ligase
LKWAVLAACLLLVPIVVAALRSSPKLMSWAAFAIGFMPFIIGQWRLYFDPVAWPLWAGAAKGIQVTALDFLCLGVLFGVKRTRTGLAPLLPWILYIAAVSVTVPLAEQPLAGVFYVWQLLRMVVIFLAAYQLAQVPNASWHLLHGVIAGVLYNVFIAVTQYLHGMAQVVGSIGHQNLLGLLTNFALVPSVALLLGERRVLWAVIGIGAALILDFLTASRAVIALAGLGTVAVLFFSGMKRMTGRKAGFAAAFLLICAVGGPLAWHSLQERRAATQIENSDSQRDALKRAAWMIISDYPLGTGPNQYVMVANLGGYSQRAGLSWDADTRATNVHDSYLLVLAETGLFGITTMVFLLLAPALRAVRAAYRYRNDPRSEILLGFGLAILVFATHLMFEWAFVVDVSQYMFAMYAGVAMGLAARLRQDAEAGAVAPKDARPRTIGPSLEWPKPSMGSVAIGGTSDAS